MPNTQIKIKGNRIPYVNSDVKEMIRQRDYLRAKANKTGSNILRQVYSQLRIKVNYTLKQLRKNYYTNKIEENKDNLKKTWQIMREAMCQGGKVSSADKVIVDGITVTDKEQIPDIFNDHFVSVGSKIADNIPGTDLSLTVNIPKTQSRFKLKQITTAQIIKIVKKLVNGKATGIHNIPNKALTDSIDIIAPMLSDIFNLSIMTSSFPDELTIRKAVAVHKASDKEDPNNYRPIAILPTIARFFEKLIYGELYNYFIEKNLLGNKQFDFRSRHSNALALGKSVDHWLMNIDNGKMNSVVFLDIKKAFDTVNHQILLQLSCHGIKDQELMFFSDLICIIEHNLAISMGKCHPTNKLDMVYHRAQYWVHHCS